jgi:hypothetical protein
MIFFIDSFVPYRTSCLLSHKKTKRHIPAKMNQQEATRAVAVSWLCAGRTVKDYEQWTLQ